MEELNEDSQIFQYYTIINNSAEVANDEAHLTIYQDVEDAQDNHVMYVSLNAENTSSNVELQPTTILQVAAQENASEPNDMRIITFGDGQMFLSSSEQLKDDSEVLSPELTNENVEEEEEATFEENATEENEHNEVSSFHQIQLADGTCAIIDSAILQTILSNMSKPEVAKKEKKFHCDYNRCDKVYSSNHHLSVHMRKHSGSQPYVCNMDGCQKAFSTSYSLKAHVRTHTGEKPYACTMCEKQFKTSGDLHKHVRTHTGEKPFMCPIKGCGRSFTTSNIRKVHVRSHTGERPYKCQYQNCGKAFSSATNFKNHVRIHTGDKPYICPVSDCGRRFTEYSSLYKHNSVHQTDRPFSCPWCSHLFKQEVSLKLHKKTVHNIFITDDGSEYSLNPNSLLIQLATPEDNDNDPLLNNQALNSENN